MTTNRREQYIKIDDRSSAIQKYFNFDNLSFCVRFTLDLDLSQVYFNKDHGRHRAQREICMQDPSEVRRENRLVGLAQS